MSDPVQQAARTAPVDVAPLPPQGMLALRADLSRPWLAGALEAAGLDLPERLRLTARGERIAIWMAPDELLLLLPADDLGAVRDGLAAALAGQHHLLADVSDARSLFAVRGADAREVLARLTPADVSPGGFDPGSARRTRLGQVAALIWMPEEGEVRVACFRSVAGYVSGLLTGAAAPSARIGLF
jgi:sarcosine oxidase subunit gamma